MDAAARASLGTVIENHLSEALDFLRRLVVVNSFTGNRAGVLRNAEIVAAHGHDAFLLDVVLNSANPKSRLEKYWSISARNSGVSLPNCHSYMPTTKGTLK